MIDENIFNFFCDKLSEVYPMHDVDRELCNQYFEYFELPKNTLYEKQGEIPQYQNFILSGKTGEFASYPTVFLFRHQIHAGWTSFRTQYLATSGDTFFPPSR